MMDKLRDTISEAMDNLIVSLQGTDDVDVADHVDVLCDKLHQTSKGSVMYREVKTSEEILQQFETYATYKGTPIFLKKNVLLAMKEYAANFQPITPPAAQPTKIDLVSINQAIEDFKKSDKWDEVDLDEEEGFPIGFECGVTWALKHQPAKIDEGDPIGRGETKDDAIEDLKIQEEEL